MRVLGVETMRVLDDAHDCAHAGDATGVRSATSNTIVRGAPDRLPVMRRSGLGASHRRRCPVKYRDASLSLDARAEREGDDIENSVNRLTGKGCSQVKIRQRRIRHP